MTGRVGVAISTTGDEHRLGFLETCVKHWCEIKDVYSLFITVDGDEDAASRVAALLYDHTGRFTDAVYRVGQGGETRKGRHGVAVNKNTGIELLMDQTDCEHLFLSDDDIWPRSRAAVELHARGRYEPHSMVCWGRHRLHGVEWTWPRGVLLYATRSVVETVGGMDERFGPGGHEHVEWSRRIHQAGFTETAFPAPAAYQTYGAMGAAVYWHAEDMRRPGEPLGVLRARKRRNTSVRRVDGDWPRIEAVMASRDGDTSFVPYRAAENGRGPATLTARSA
jgi:hypothetical protein